MWIIYPYTQAKKVKGVQAAFKVYNIAMRTPGKGELTMVELRVGAVRAVVCSTSICVPDDTFLLRLRLV
jgi:hypothetical protein